MKTETGVSYPASQLWTRLLSRNMRISVGLRMISTEYDKRLTADFGMKRWKQLRDQFVRNNNYMMRSKFSGSATVSGKQYRHYHALTFCWIICNIDRYRGWHVILLDRFFVQEPSEILHWNWIQVWRQIPRDRTIHLTRVASVKCFSTYVYCDNKDLFGAEWRKEGWSQEEMILVNTT